MSIQLINPTTGKYLKKADDVFIDPDGNKFPIVNGIARFVPAQNYADNFGFQWNKFSKVQIDADTEQDQSRERLLGETGWDKASIKGMDVLEVGSGAGRFSSVFLREFEANLYSLDYSNAVEANKANNQEFFNFFLIQASIYEMPFPKNSFDKVFCLGVLQHTPDFEQSVKSLIDMVKPGGELVVDFYPIKGWYTKIQAKYLLRPFTKNMDHEKLLDRIEKNVDWMIKWTQFFTRIGVGKIFNRFIPICDIERTVPKGLTKEEVKEWCILDTFDMFSPEFDNPQRVSTVAGWFRANGMTVTHEGQLNINDQLEPNVVRGIKKVGFTTS